VVGKKGEQVKKLFASLVGLGLAVPLIFAGPAAAQDIYSGTAAGRQVATPPDTLNVATAHMVVPDFDSGYCVDAPQRRSFWVGVGQSDPDASDYTGHFLQTGIQATALVQYQQPTYYVWYQNYTVGSFATPYPIQIEIQEGDELYFAVNRWHDAQGWHANVRVSNLEPNRSPYTTGSVPMIGDVTVTGNSVEFFEEHVPLSDAWMKSTGTQWNTEKTGVDTSNLHDAGYYTSDQNRWTLVNHNWTISNPSANHMQDTSLNNPNGSSHLTGWRDCDY
jgi:hypothetical protein